MRTLSPARPREVVPVRLRQGADHALGLAHGVLAGALLALAILAGCARDQDAGFSDVRGCREGLGIGRCIETNGTDAARRTRAKGVTFLEARDLDGSGTVEPTLDRADLLPA